MAKNSDNVFEKIQNPYGPIKHAIAVMSGKGGVGKSSITAMLASALNRKGYRVGILDADITGPSIPKIFGIKGRADVIDNVILPRESGNGVRIMSINLLLDKEDDPVIWRGPLIAGTVKQFYEQVNWGSLDFLVVDLPPGTGDVPLTVMQSLPLDGLIVGTSPQELVALIVKKAIHMAEKMAIPVLGMIENMSYYQCPECGKQVDIFGKSRIEKVAGDTGIPVLGRLPVMPEVAAFSDEGRIEEMGSTGKDIFEKVVSNLFMRANW
mgnify:CR=1 FL=1